MTEQITQNNSLPVISVNDLTRCFGDFTAVDHITFTVDPGQIIGYLGPNGSGKTTTIRMLLGIIRPTSGSACVLGYDSARQSELVRAGVGYMSQKFALYNELTALENMIFYGGVYGVGDRHRIDEVLEQLGLASVAGQQVKTLSTGWRQRLALGTAIVHRPRVLLLDEPTSGVDPVARRAFWDMIYDLVAQGITVLVTTHYMDEAEYCTHVGILNKGQLLALDTPTKLKQRLPGKMWEIVFNSEVTISSSPLLAVLDHLSGMPGVLRASLAGDHLRVLTIPEISHENLLTFLSSTGISGITIESAESMMEDVFMSLVGKKEKLHE